MRRNLWLALSGLLLGVGLVAGGWWLVAGGWRPGPSRLLFLRQQDGHANLWLAAADGSQLRQLTDEPLGVWDYAPSPDGRHIVFSAIGRNDASDLVLIDRNGGSRRLLVTCQPVACSGGRWQPGGPLIAYERQDPDGRNTVQVWLVDTADGQSWSTHPHDLLAEAGFASEVSRSPRWSADGRYLSLYLPEVNALAVLDMSGGQPSLIPVILNDMGEWSANGYRLAYTALIILPPPGADEASARQEEGEEGELGEEGDGSLVSHLVISDLEAGVTTDLSQGLTTTDGRPAWQPGHDVLAFTRGPAGGARQIWLMPADGGGEATTLTDEPSVNHSALTWSPDGRLLAFMRLDQTTPSSPPAIWVYDVEAQIMRPVVEAGFLPAWLP